MKNKSKFLAIGLFAGLAIFGFSESFAAQSCQEVPGNLKLVPVKGTTKDEFGYNALKRDLRMRLDEEAKISCSEAAFCVVDASIETNFFFNTWTRVLHGKMTAVVNCLE